MSRNVLAIEAIWAEFYGEDYVKSITNGIIKKLKFSFNDELPDSKSMLIAYYNYPDNLPSHRRMRYHHIGLYAISLSNEMFEILDNKKLVNLLEEETKRLLDDAVDEWEWFYDRYAFWS